MENKRTEGNISNNEKKIFSLIDILDKLVVPVLLGILVWTADNSANKISESQTKLANAQFKASEMRESREEMRESRELDGQLVDLFGKYYFSDDSEKRSFAINLIGKLTSPELQNALAQTIGTNPQENEENKKEASRISEKAQQKICNPIVNVKEDFWGIQTKPTVIYVEIKKDELENFRKQLIRRLNAILRPPITYGTEVHPDINFGNEVRYFSSSDKQIAQGVKCVADQLSNRSFELVFSRSPEASEGQVEIWVNE